MLGKTKGLILGKGDDAFRDIGVWSAVGFQPAVGAPAEERWEHTKAHLESYLQQIEAALGKLYSKGWRWSGGMM